MKDKLASKNVIRFELTSVFDSLSLGFLAPVVAEELFKFYVRKNWDGVLLFQRKREKSGLSENPSCQL